MGFFDRLKKMLGGDDDAKASPESEAPAEGEQANDARKGSRRPGQRPPLGAPPPPTATLDDALEAREGGDRRKARAILQAIDRGAGLRTVLRAAAALEDGEDAEVQTLAAQVLAGDARWRVPLQVAAAYGAEPEKSASVARAEQLVTRASEAGAPRFAIAWARAASPDDDAQRAALVELLFLDAPFARTVAARDLSIEGVHEDGTAIARWASLDAGRAAIRRFGTDAVAALFDRLAPKGQA